MKTEYIKFQNFIDSTQYGYTADETSFENGDCKYLRITDIVPYFVEKETVPFCKIPEEKKAQYMITDGDLLIARTGATTGYNLIVDDSFKNFIFASYLIRFNYDKKKLFPLYVKYVLKSKLWYGFVNNYISGSAQPGMNARVFGKFNFPYVPLSTQQKIASILSAYDKLIQNYKKQIEALQTAASELYKEWFVRFRFPGYQTAKFENGIPEGWKVEKVGDYCKVFTGKKDVNQTVEDGKYAFFSCSPDTFKSNEYIFDGKAILVAGNGSYTGRTRFFEGKFDLYQRTYAITTEKQDFIEYLYWVFKNDFESRYSGGTRGAAIPYIVLGDITKYKFLYSEELVRKFVSYVIPINKKLDLLQQQITNLTQQRDLLLPRLMSGKLEVE